ncbi:N-acetyl-gamma-glutamyl-phosphate reductase [Pullulanibacillus pueri]|uniref:N-acetyl-gamma-glutamyl-phosphate reductase n=1 Tax=Pullulanibacillus pueri TaxID=1437324 RepID=A0A8J2ZXN2_9BACL|nr:N-acetyl-gamma-glutamyl-phosphate reductase [Pullulanibacillus pueri]MBM7683233.1 N-acetyl-gamma-glutamyl-phosphate reductase [Pullulanibacillus pueri]GGH85499.1 N-acetyl-gamma-glutamyl-phosphate reductase [Pullulanibacillus pueri]
MKVGIVGANGYSGVELIRLLSQHPHVDIDMLISHSTSGTHIHEIYPHLCGICEKKLEQADADEIAKRVELVFFSTPAGVSQGLIPELIEKGIRCIDISGDFRLKEAEQYEKWYGRECVANPDVLQQAVYGLSEFTREQISVAKLIANPGCFPTATLLGILPAVELGLIAPHTIIIDGKSGVSGAGRGAKQANMYSEVNESIKAYKLGSHQHIPEIEQAITEVAQQDVKVTFSTHLVPMTRGILCTIYAELKASQSSEAIIEAYKSFYASSPFVRIRELGHWPTTKEVLGSNYCDIGLLADERTNRLTVVSVIDNVVKGASGQAIQNMNILCGWDENTGLTMTPVYP